MNENRPDKTCAVPGPIPPADWAAARDAAIEDFLSRFATDCPDRDVLADLMVAITRLARDGAGRGDLKLLTSSFKELRYAFKVFAPYHGIRKVSIFGSSRTPAGHPDFLQAVEFARRMRERRWMIITGAGDGIMGEYGVQAILADKELMSRSAAFVLCANDPAGVAGAVADLRDHYGIVVDVVSGPATDNRVGTRFVEREFGIPGINARTRSDELGELILEKAKARLKK